MYIQTLVLALTNAGLGTCLEVSIAGYPDVVRGELGVGEELEIICGLAVGYADGGFGANRIRIGRVSVESTTVFLED